MKLNFKGMQLLSKVLDEIGFMQYQEGLVKNTLYKVNKFTAKTEKEKESFKQNLSVSVMGNVISFIVTKSHLSDTLLQLLSSYSSIDEKELEEKEFHEILEIEIGLIKYIFGKKNILEKLGIKGNIDDIMKKANV